jgi:hypothetical protein
MIRYILYWIFNTLLVRYACKWIQTRDSIQESSERAKYTFQWFPMVGSRDNWNAGMRRTEFTASLTEMYNALVWPHFNNCSTIWNDGFWLIMDHSPINQNFVLNKSRQKFHHSLKEHHKISNIPKFRCKML